MAEQMVVILGSKVRTEADTFAYAIPLISEWEGRREGPVLEVDFIDQWLREHPGTAVTPFRRLLQAHRLRAGYEAARAEREEELWPALAARYRKAITNVKEFKEPLISCIADDLEMQPYVYLKGQGKP